MGELSGAFPLNHIEQSRSVDHYVEGGKRAMSFMREVLVGKKVRGERYDYDGGLLVEINRRVLWYAHPDARGQLRPADDYGTEVDTEPVARGFDVRSRFPLFGRWLSENSHTVAENPHDISHAIEVAAAAHYGLTGPQLHPFVDGNGRTARILVNGILMIGTKEFMEHGLAVPPVPMLRAERTVKGRIDPYVVALRKVGKDRRLNPLEVFIAEKWAANLEHRLLQIRETIHKPTRGDKDLIDQLTRRSDSLSALIAAENNNQRESHLIPNYFEPRYIK